MSTLPFLVLGALLAVTYPCGIESDSFDPGASLTAVLSLTAILPLLGALLGARTLRHLNRAGDPEAGERAVRTFLRSAFLYRLLLLAAYAAQLYFWRWPDVLAEAGLADVPLLGRILILAPYLFLIFSSWIVLFPVERRLRARTPTLARHLSVQIRSAFAFFLGPFVIMAGISEGIERIPWFEREFIVYPFTAWIFSLGLVALMFAMSPWILRLIWSARPLPAGALRDRLEALSRRAACPARDFLVWPTGGTIANAAVTGLLPPLRYVMITDTLIDQLDPDALDAVVGHELGHAHHRHLWIYFTATIGYVLAMVTLEEGVTRWFPRLPGGLLFSATGMMLLYWGTFFRQIGRRFEMQADIFGANLCGDPERMAHALETVAWLNGQPKSVATLMHPSIAERVAFLRAGTFLPTLIPAFERVVRRHLLVMTGVVATAAAGAALVSASQWRDAPARAVRYHAYELAREANVLYLAGDDRAAVEKIVEAIRLDRSERSYLRLLREALQRSGDDPRVLKEAMKAMDRTPPPAKEER